MRIDVMLNLFILLLERVGLIILLAYILMNINHFKTMMSERDKWRSKFQLIIIFGIFSMISNFTGIEIEMAISYLVIFITT